MVMALRLGKCRAPSLPTRSVVRKSVGSSPTPLKIFWSLEFRPARSFHILYNTNYSVAVDFNSDLLCIALRDKWRDKAELRYRLSLVPARC